MSKLVALLARNTLLIFIIHMPFIYAFSQDYYQIFGNSNASRLIWIAIIFVVLALFSELITRTIRLKSIRDWLWRLLVRIKLVAA